MTARTTPHTQTPEAQAIADCLTDGAVAGLSLPLPAADDVIVIECSREDLLGARALLLALADLKDTPLICVPEYDSIHITLLTNPWAEWKRATVQLWRALWGASR